MVLILKTGLPRGKPVLFSSCRWEILFAPFGYDVFLVLSLSLENEQSDDAASEEQQDRVCLLGSC